MTLSCSYPSNAQVSLGVCLARPQINGDPHVVKRGDQGLKCIVHAQRHGSTVQCALCDGKTRSPQGHVPATYYNLYSNPRSRRRPPSETLSTVRTTMF
ncbi:hypothetical protein RRG08_003844 [Elysia crispata]|uniref:Uncharacterized protein n=1 Tax=Elysia crispata TaxID=231223 RepID=A0AAE0ZE32_9GAST|nr:hypothetical protein RRG08_003844 [Elysia crispata]